jgi:hypothetical protein
MKLTNKFNIPQTFINVLDRPTYSKGKAHLSVTQLLNSPKIVALTKKFEDEIEQDASDMVWSIFGSAVHNVLEHGKDDNHIVEERIHKEYEGWHISGAIDLQVVNNAGIDVKDYKTTTIWAVMNEKVEWEIQLNIYAGLVEDVKNIPVTSVGIVAIIRDWNRRESTTREGYPEAPIKELPIRLWSKEERDAFISNRIALHSACEFALETDGELPDCTPEEMWEKPTVWAVRKIGNKRAHSLYETEQLAIEALKDLGDKYEMEVRKGERTRCTNFCPVNTWCTQYQTYLKEQL